MIELNDWQLRLLQGAEKLNCKKYIKVFEDHYYCKIDELFYCIEDTQENREFAEDKLQEVINDYEEKLHDKNPNIVDCIWYKEQLHKACEEVERLKEENDALKAECLKVCNEDALDELAMEGVEL